MESSTSEHISQYFDLDLNIQNRSKGYEEKKKRYTFNTKNGFLGNGSFGYVRIILYIKN